MVARLSRHPREVHTHIVYTLVGEMLPCVETSEMAANSVKKSLPSLPDEHHPLNYFPFFKRLIGKLIAKLVLQGAMRRKANIHADVDVCHLVTVLV